MISPFFGGGMLLNRRNRNFQHFLLQISGLICGMTSFGLMAQNLQCSFHGLTGTKLKNIESMNMRRLLLLKF